MLTLEELETINNFNTKPNQKFKNQINKIEEKKSLLNYINQYSNFEYRNIKLQEKLKLSSKHLKNDNNLFNLNTSNFNNFKILSVNNYKNDNPTNFSSEKNLFSTNLTDNIIFESTPLKINISNNQEQNIFNNKNINDMSLNKFIIPSENKINKLSILILKNRILIISI